MQYSQPDRCALGDDLRAEQNAATGADVHVATDDRVGRHVRQWVDVRPFDFMGDEHAPMLGPILTDQSILLCGAGAECPMR